MSNKIRIVIQNSTSNFDERIPFMVENSIETRKEPGCLQFEHFRSVETPEHSVLLELWEDQEIYDKHWNLRLETGSGRGGPAVQRVDRQYGSNGAEWYHHERYTLLYNRWVPADRYLQMGTVRWPARGNIRLVIQMTMADVDAAIPNLAKEAQETRKEQGCLEYEYFRSIEFPEQVTLLELWESPEIYDAHWKLRLEQRAAAGPRPAAPPVPRRHGENGVEFYQHLGYFTPVDGVWMAADPANRMETVRWA